jgi:uncharacterized protein with beta-barrel porin domain
MNNSNLKLKLNVVPVDTSRSLPNPLLKTAIGFAVLAACSAQSLAAPNPNLAAVGTALARCTNTDIAVCQANNADLQSLTPDQVFGMGSMATRINGGQNTMPYDYFGANRKGKGKAGGGAGDLDLSALNFWGKVDSGFGSQDATAVNMSGFKFDNHNFMAGADYRINERWMAGANFNYRHSNATFNAGRGETLSDGYTGGLYSSYFISDALHVDATATYGGIDYETKRNIVLFGNSSVAMAKPTAQQYSFSWGGGYDFNYSALTVAPYVRGEYIGLGIDRYSEYGSAAAVQFGKQNIDSLISTLGVQSSYAFSFPWGVLIPQLRGEWHHQFLDGSRSVTGSFVEAGSISRFTLVNDGPSRDYYTVGAEVSSVLPGGVSAFLAYETLQGYQNINSNRLMLGGRVEF